MGFRHESGRQQACSGALFRHALFRQGQADVAVDQAVAHAVGERLGRLRVGLEQGCKSRPGEFLVSSRAARPVSGLRVECRPKMKATETGAPGYPAGGLSGLIAGPGLGVYSC